MHTTSTMTDILQKVLYYVRQKQTACTLVVSSRHNIERYAFPVLYIAKKRSKESRQANTGTIQNFYFSFLCVSISNKRRNYKLFYLIEAVTLAVI